MFLAPVTQAHTRQLVAQAREIWTPYRELSLQVLSADAAQLPVRLPAVVGYAKAHNLELLSLMNALTTELETLTRREASPHALVPGHHLHAGVAQLRGRVRPVPAAHPAGASSCKTCSTRSSTRWRPV